MIVRETSNGYFRYSIEEDMLSKREVECVGEITPESAYSIARQLRWLERENPSAEITLLISSPGGDVHSGLALYDVMRSLSCPIRTVCMGTAASMAAILFAAGSRREILPHGRVMIHDPLISNGSGRQRLTGAGRQQPGCWNPAKSCAPFWPNAPEKAFSRFTARPVKIRTSTRRVPWPSAWLTASSRKFKL